MQWLARICVGRPVFTWVLMIVVVVLGAVSFRGLGLDKYPNIDNPTVVVTTDQVGASPEEIESEITDKIEAAINTISGIDEVTSKSTEGVSQVTISFVLEKSADVAAQEVRDKVNNILADLPDDIEQPVISKFDPDSAPILYLTLSGQGSIRDLSETADKQVRRQIENVNGVGEVTLVGSTKRQIKIWLDPIRLSAQGITASNVATNIKSQNFSRPGGTVERGPKEMSLRVLGKVTNLDELRKLKISTASNSSVLLEDVATVEDGAEDVSSWASYDGKRAVVLAIRKQSGANTVSVVDAVKARLGDVQRGLPQGLTIEVVRDNSESIRTSVSAVEEHLVLGAVLAAVVVLLFLGSARSTVIAALAIPISIIGAFVVVKLLGFTLNMMTLLALALAVGIVIDDAIVVLENIHRFITAKGEPPAQAAVSATKDIGLAVLATTLSLLAVFIPVAFMSGIVGRFLSSFGLTMAAAIVFSLLVSFTLTPMLSARWLKAHAEASQKRSIVERAVDGFYHPIERVYLVVLRWVMRRRWVVVVACIGTLGTCVPLVKVVPSSFVPSSDDAQFSVSVRAPEGTSVSQTRLIADRIAADLRRIPGVTHTLMTIGDSTTAGRNEASIYVRLTDPSERSQSQAEILDRTRHEILAKQSSDLRVSANTVSDFGSSTGAIQYRLTGTDLGKLAAFSNEITSKLAKQAGVVDVESSLIIGKPEAKLRVDRDRAATLGVDPLEVATTLQLLIGGQKISTYSERGEDYDIRARARREYRIDQRAALITVSSKSGGTVPLDSVVNIEQGTGASEIDRVSRRRAVTISCNVEAGLGESVASDALARIVKDIHLPPGYTASAAGTSKESGKAATSFLVAFGMSFLFMYLILAAQFESWLHPVTILISLPLTVPFALLSILIFGQQLTIFSALGVLVLFGVVKKNAILQIDHTLHLRREGLAREDAILHANRDRLRPILMTTIAFVAGMLPLLFSRGIGAGLNQGIAGVIVGGQVLSLVLTLLATPVFYSLFDDVIEWRARRRNRPDKRIGDLSG